MSNIEEQDLDLTSLDGGKRKKTKNPKRRGRTQKKGNEIIVGKIYATWCGHCHALKPEWKKMRKILKRKPNGRKFKFVEIEEKQMGQKLPKFKQDYNVDLQANGYPSLFRFEKGRVSYYEGERTAHQMAEWYYQGGGQNGMQQQNGMHQQNDQQQNLQGDTQMPGLMADMQGGKRYYRHKYSSKHNTYYPRSNKTYRHNSRKTERNDGGLWNYLFGK